MLQTVKNSLQNEGGIKTFWNKVEKGKLLSHKKEEKLAICDSMDRSWRHYAKWNKSEENTIWSQLCGIWGKKKTATTKKTRNQIHWYRKQIGGAIGKGWKVGKMGEGSQNIQTSNYKINYGSVIYSMVPIFNYTLLYIWKLLRE